MFTTVPELRTYFFEHFLGCRSEMAYELGIVHVCLFALLPEPGRT